MKFLSGVNCPEAVELANSHGTGIIPQPDSYGPSVCALYPVHALDNGCVSVINGAPVPNPSWTPDRWRRWLDRMPRAGCLFAVVPDVVGDAEATLRCWEKYESVVAGMGFPRAFVLQNGQERHAVPPAEAVFIGGDTAWKLGHMAAFLTLQAQHSGQHVHMGRANSLKRLRRAAEMHCDSADGTFLKFAPKINGPRLAAFLDGLPRDQQLALA